MSNAPSSSRPTVVTVSFVLWLISVVLWILTSVLFIVAGVAAIAENTEKTEAVAVLIAGIILLALTLLILFFAIRMRGGRNWARITLTVLGILSLLGSLSPGSTGTGDTGGGSFSVSITTGVLAVVAIVLMWLPSANRYFGRGAPAKATPAHP